MSYTKILITAYYLTLKNRILWLFGLFVIGGFNLNFFHFGNVPAARTIQQFSPHEVLIYYSNHPGSLALTSFLVLVTTVSALLITNWTRVMLTLTAESLYKQRRADIPKQIAKSKHVLGSVIYVSLLTASFMVGVVCALLVPPLLFADLRLQILFWVFSGIVLVPLAFTISCINIFTTLFVILFKKTPTSALQLGTDFFLVNWIKILGLAVILAIIYLACFMGGVGIIYLSRTILISLIQTYLGFNFFAVSAIIVIRFVLFMCLWLFLAVLSVFFNVALLLLFLELITPVKTEDEKETVLKPSPVLI